MSDFDALFAEFVDLHHAGQTPSVREYAARVPEREGELADLLMAFLDSVPAPRPSDEAIARVGAQLARARPSESLAAQERTDEVGAKDRAASAIPRRTQPARRLLRSRLWPIPRPVLAAAVAGLVGIAVASVLGSLGADEKRPVAVSPPARTARREPARPPARIVVPVPSTAHFGDDPADDPIRITLSESLVAARERNGRVFCRNLSVRFARAWFGGRRLCRGAVARGDIPSVFTSLRGEPGRSVSRAGGNSAYCRIAGVTFDFVFERNHPRIDGVR